MQRSRTVHRIRPAARASDGVHGADFGRHLALRLWRESWVGRQGGILSGMEEGNLGYGRSWNRKQASSMAGGLFDDAAR